jgi:hypothetical protein
MEKSMLAKAKALNTKRIIKSINLLMGMVSGIVCDDKLQDAEVQYLSTWLSEHNELAREYPASVIYRRVREVLRDGLITEPERAHLLSELKVWSGTNFIETGAAASE